MSTRKHILPNIRSDLDPVPKEPKLAEFAGECITYPIVPKWIDGAADEVEIVDEGADNIVEPACPFPTDGAN